MTNELRKHELSSEGTPEPYALPADEVARQLETDVNKGLPSQQVLRRQQQHGANVLDEAPRSPLVRRMARQFASLLVGILLAAALLSGLMGEWPEAIAILAIVLLNGVIGFIQEERAERALTALRKLAAPSCRVTRDGRESNLPAAELVPGDLIHIEAGDHVPADARLIHSIQLSTQEAALTGESSPVWKDYRSVLAADAQVGDRINMLHAGTVVATGKGQAVVVAIGMHTELGRIAGLLERSEDEETPLQRRLAALGRYLVVACLVLVAAIFGLNVARGHDPFEAFLFAVSLAVAAVPEGLPAVVTIALALGVRRMARRHALVRRLPAVETLGCVTVVCTDKTGTLTRNEMTVREVWTFRSHVHVSGAGYDAQGEFTKWTSRPPDVSSSANEGVDPKADRDLMQAIAIGAICNNAQVKCESDGACQVVGDPTEAALRVLAAKAGLDGSTAERLHEIPFDSDRKAMSVIAKRSDEGVALYCKGAAEVLLAKSTRRQQQGGIVEMSEADLTAARKASREMARRALRVLGLAWRPVDPAKPNQVEESDLIFVGLVGMMDPPREEARAAVRRCREAGIRPVMITGDHPETALAIAQELELAEENAHVVTGAELDGLAEEALSERIDEVSVFARVSAEHKLRVVRCLRSRDHVAAMTGDGVNDAPAVKAADIGIAMGRTGTDVTRAASDMVLLDDNFASIVAAVEEGRGIFDNIQKVTHYLLACNAGELVLLLFAAIVGWPVPLLAVQILWINLITDGVPALALGVEPPEPDIMQRRPRRPSEPLITGAEARSILLHGCLIAAVAAAGFAWFTGPGGATLPQARAAVFSIAAFTQLFFAIGCRSRRYTMPQIGWLTNPSLGWAIVASAALQVGVTSVPMFRTLLKTDALRLDQWSLVIVLSLLPVTVVESSKLLRAAWRRRRVL